MDKECSVCGGERKVLGQLGKIVHFRCANCGMMSMAEGTDYTEQDEEDYYEEFENHG